MITLSARDKYSLEHIEDYLIRIFPNIELTEIDSIFGFAAPCKMYGGRIYESAQLIDTDLQWMYDRNIGFRIPLTSCIIDRKMYEESLPFLEKYHRNGNSIILMKDKVVEWVRKDFPLYKIECSVIKEIKTLQTLIKTLELYDTAVPLAEVFNINYELLNSIPHELKPRVRLFLNLSCSFNCPAKICYPSMAKLNAGMQVDTMCSQKLNSYTPKNIMTHFNKQRYIDMGFNLFKMIPPKH